MSENQFPRKCAWVESLPDADMDCCFYRIGNKYKPFGAGEDKYSDITEITLQDDVPGLHCNMLRVCVWSGEALLVELPYSGVKAIGYDNA